MDELKNITEKLEYIFLRTLIDTLRKETMNDQEAKVFAQDFLKLQPFSSVEDAKTKMQTFVQQSPVFIKLDGYMNSYREEQKINSVIQRMQKHLLDHKIDEALEVAKSTS